MELTNAAFVLTVALIGLIAAMPGLVALAMHARATARRVDDLESAQLKEATERGRLQHEVDELRRGIAVLIAQVRRAGMAPDWQPPPPLPPVVSRRQTEMDELVELWQRIADQFDMEEQADLWFEMGFHDEARGETVGARARALVLHAKRRNRLGALVELCRRSRPEGGF